MVVGPRIIQHNKVLGPTDIAGAADKSMSTPVVYDYLHTLRIDISVAEVDVDMIC